MTKFINLYYFLINVQNSKTIKVLGRREIIFRLIINYKIIQSQYLILD
jgi:hypothetical protein